MRLTLCNPLQGRSCSASEPHKMCGSGSGERNPQSGGSISHVIDGGCIPVVGDSNPQFPALIGALTVPSLHTPHH